MFHAGHCDWQRPHSVHEVKSSRPFQVKSSTLPTPNDGVLVEVVDVLEVDRLAAGHHRLQTAQRRCGRRRSRLNQMFGHAVKRCHATPIVVLSASTIIQVNEMTILTIATR